MCDENEQVHRISSSNNPLIIFVSTSIDDHFVVINCSTPERVPHHKLDWYFQTRTSSKPPRVIWQRGRSNIPRYIAYSPDQIRHFLQIRPIHSNDSGTYMCLDQTTGFYDRTELLIGQYFFFNSLWNSFSFVYSRSSKFCWSVCYCTYSNIDSLRYIFILNISAWQVKKQFYPISSFV